MRGEVEDIVVLTADVYEAIHRALNFYGNEANWEQAVTTIDAGERARNVLGMIEGEANGANGEG